MRHKDFRRPRKDRYFISLLTFLIGNGWVTFSLCTFYERLFRYITFLLLSRKIKAISAISINTNAAGVSWSDLLPLRQITFKYYYHLTEVLLNTLMQIEFPLWIVHFFFFFWKTKIYSGVGFNLPFLTFVCERFQTLLWILVFLFWNIKKQNKIQQNKKKSVASLTVSGGQTFLFLALWVRE